MKSVRIRTIKVLNKYPTKKSFPSRDESHWFEVIVILEVHPSDGLNPIAWNAEDFSPVTFYSKPDLDSKLLQGYQESSSHLKYKEKFNVFVYRSYVIDCAASRGVIDDLIKLEAGFNPSHTTEEFFVSYLLKCLDCLVD